MKWITIVLVGILTTCKSSDSPETDSNPEVSRLPSALEINGSNVKLDASKIDKAILLWLIDNKGQRTQPISAWFPNLEPGQYTLVFDMNRAGISIVNAVGVESLNDVPGEVKSPEVVDLGPQNTNGYIDFSLIDQSGRRTDQRASGISDGTYLLYYLTSHPDILIRLQGADHSR